MNIKELKLNNKKPNKLNTLTVMRIPKRRKSIREEISHQATKSLQMTKSDLKNQKSLENNHNPPKKTKGDLKNQRSNLIPQRKRKTIQEVNTPKTWTKSSSTLIKRTLTLLPSSLAILKTRP
jgi:transcriptional regulator of met regulon